MLSTGMTWPQQFCLVLHYGSHCYGLSVMPQLRALVQKKLFRALYNAPWQEGWTSIPLAQIPSCLILFRTCLNIKCWPFRYRNQEMIARHFGISSKNLLNPKEVRHGTPSSLNSSQIEYWFLKHAKQYLATTFWALQMTIIEWQADYRWLLFLSECLTGSAPTPLQERPAPQGVLDSMATLVPKNMLQDMHPNGLSVHPIAIITQNIPLNPSTHAPNPLETNRKKPRNHMRQCKLPKPAAADGREVAMFSMAWNRRSGALPTPG